MIINERREGMAVTDINVGELRKTLRMNQSEFWSRIGVTQSGGSRYEHGRAIPKPVRILLQLVYVQGLNVCSVERGDFGVIDYLKSEDRPLLSKLKRVAAKRRSAAKN